MSDTFFRAPVPVNMSPYDCGVLFFAKCWFLVPTGLALAAGSTVHTNGYFLGIFTGFLYHVIGNS